MKLIFTIEADSKEEVSPYIDGPEWSIVVEELVREIRKHRKYESDIKTAEEAFEHVWKFIHEELRARNLEVTA